MQSEERLQASCPGNSDLTRDPVSSAPDSPSKNSKSGGNSSQRQSRSRTARGLSFNVSADPKFNAVQVGQTQPLKNIIRVPNLDNPESRLGRT